MAIFFVLALLGHLVGDYLLQSQWMAVNKSSRGWFGTLTCTVHVAVYTLAIVTFLHLYTPNPLFFASWFFALYLTFFARFNNVAAGIALGCLLVTAGYCLHHPIAIFLIAIPHWLIDRTSFANYFLGWKNGTRVFDTLQPGDLLTSEKLWAVAFGSFTYVLNDNTMHILCLMAVGKWILHWW